MGEAVDEERERERECAAVRHGLCAAVSRAEASERERGGSGCVNECERQTTKGGRRTRRQ